MPGTMVSDSLALSLHDGTAITATGAGSAGWVECDWPCDVAQVEAVIAACSGTGAVVYIQIQGATDSSGTGKVVMGVLGPITDASDNLTYRVPVYMDKKYIRAYAYAAGTTPSVTPTIKLREKHYQKTATTTGGLAT